MQSNPQSNPVFWNGFQIQVQSTKKECNQDFAILQSQSHRCLVTGKCRKNEMFLFGRLVTMESFNNLGLTFVDELKILGIRFNRDNNQITSYNLAPLLPILTVEAAQWRRRNLSLMGKITVIKSLLLSKLVHILTALPNPSDEDIKKINNIFYRFIWNDGADKIKRARIVQYYHNDGLKMIDLRSFMKGLKISWLKRLYWANVDSPWAHLAKQNFPPVEEMVAFGSI